MGQEKETKTKAADLLGAGCRQRHFTPLPNQTHPALSQAALKKLATTSD